MVEQISDTILKKLKEICNEPDGKDGGGKDGGGTQGGNGDDNSDEFKMILELLETTDYFDKQTKAIAIRKQFQQIADQYFPYIVKQDE